MSYGAAAALQAALFQRLAAWPDLADVPVHDALPKGGGRGTWVLIGPEEVRDVSDSTGGGAEHRFTISVISDAAGFLEAKRVAASVSDALEDASLALGRGRLVGLRFLKGTARRLASGGARRIDLIFRARIED
ncbi:DUF3168 domain-containing protein [Cereibacter azotoformans]|uniref:Uncharacterized protein DUF3168 n=1 Tax=Cereibacter azotoformans TaxID=43057 RepID=A0A2T5K9N2_9RHOB|nr:DUF3168 domain-containing protein [Cereibacter azotoformans]AXQ93233.1 DUF3168 domain-containing protein [Cereibacter sphaeroides]MBO4169107.1 DUF3168 domain-containing protein [Cereibacter azotoformans]PTR19042.1 uncharacterized protein DUF3168 [Cereibacter azotoformans]UIJ31548.1 DUF3168 domain-containing protein [Cereibacter azotoformans]